MNLIDLCLTEGFFSVFRLGTFLDKQLLVTYKESTWGYLVPDQETLLMAT